MQLAHDSLMIEKLEEELYDNYDRGYMLREYLSISPNDQEAKKELNRLVNEKLEIELKIKLHKVQEETMYKIVYLKNGKVVVETPVKKNRVINVLNSKLKVISVQLLIG